MDRTMTAVQEEESQHQQHLQQHQEDMVERSSSSSSLSSSASLLVNRTTTTTTTTPPTLNTPTMPPEDKSEHTATEPNMPTTDAATAGAGGALNENGKRSRPEQEDGEQQNGGRLQQHKQEEQTAAASGTVSCSENQSESSSSSSASSPESLRKVARLDGLAAAAAGTISSQNQQQQPQPVYPTPSTTATTAQTATTAAPGIINITAGAPPSYQNQVTTSTTMQYPSSSAGSAAAVASSIVPIGPSTMVMHHNSHPPAHHAPPMHQHQHPNTMMAVGGTVAGPPTFAGAILPKQQQQQQQQQQQEDTQKNVVNGTGGLEKKLRPFPYFYYRDFSHVPDPDPLSPLTAPGRVPNFPAKMHSILSRADLADVVSWNEHGRAWRVLKPREFEVKVIPTYFEHAKFSSFIRQANGWGFRRITQGKDRNSYYHEMFLRGLPHLCKMMKRPGVAEKQAADPDQEPDFYRISQEHPIPERAQDESILLQCTLQGGPKARMPIYFGALTASMAGTHAKPGSAVQQPNHVTPPSAPPGSGTPHQTVHAAHAETNSYGNFRLPAPASVNGSKVAVATHSTPGGAVYHAPGQQQGTTDQGVTLINPSLTMPANANPQFAAGFAAAQKQFQALFGNVLASQGPASSPQVASNQNNSGGVQPAPFASGASNPAQQQQHFAPLLPRPQHPPHNPHVVIHPIVHNQQQQQGQHYPGAVAQPYVQQIAYHPVQMNAVQATEHSQLYQPQQQHHDGQYYQPIPLTQGQATNLAPAPYDYGKNGQQQQQNDNDQQQQQQQTYYVGTSQSAAPSSDYRHQSPAVAVQHS